MNTDLRIAWTLLLAGSLAGWGCQESAGPPVGELTVTPSEFQLGFPEHGELEVGLAMNEAIEASNPTLMVHLLDADGRVARTFDHPIPGGWEAGSERTYSIMLYQSALAEALPKGAYTLTMGLYDGDQRWALATSGAEVDDQEYEVARVNAVTGEAPVFLFSPEDWRAPLPGTDKQTLVRRWLADDGVLRIADIKSPGVVRLAIELPEPDPTAEDPVFEEGEVEPGYRLSTRCGEDEESVEVFATRGYGAELVEVPVPGDRPELPQYCEIEFHTFSHHVSRPDLTTRSLVLTNLTWAPS